jgi:hypothetical protein
MKLEFLNRIYRMLRGMEKFKKEKAANAQEAVVIVDTAKQAEPCSKICPTCSNKCCINCVHCESLEQFNAQRESEVAARKTTAGLLTYAALNRSVSRLRALSYPTESGSFLGSQVVTSKGSRDSELGNWNCHIMHFPSSSGLPKRCMRNVRPDRA